MNFRDFLKKGEQEAQEQKQEEQDTGTPPAEGSDTEDKAGEGSE
jgi:hypothetical protein